MSEHYDVVIATPGEWFNQHYVWSINQTIRYLEQNNISWIWLNDYSSHVGEVRQRLIDQACELSYNKLFWIDSDIYWNVDQFMRLYQSWHDIISGCYITTANRIAAQDFDRQLIDPDYIRFKREPFEVRSTGFGFMCMKNGIIENIKDPMMPSDSDLNEDISFCLRVKNELGVPIMLDPTIKLDHFRTVSLGWGEV